MKNTRMKFFCDHARAMMACYVDMPPEQQMLARLFAAKKLESLRLIQAAATAPGGEMAAELLTKLQQLDSGS